MHDLTALTRPRSAQNLLNKGELQLRKELRHFAVPPNLCDSAPPIQPRVFLESLASTLELHVTIAALGEAMLELGIRVFGALCRRLPEVMEFATRRARVDIAAVIERNRKLWPESSSRMDENDPVGLDMDTTLRHIKSLLVHVRMDEVEPFARSLELGELAHRCRTAYDSLSALVRRSSSAMREKERVVGRLFAAGSVTLAEAASLLELSRTDAIALFEAAGFCRSAADLRLSDVERREILARIRADREAREGRAQLCPELVARDVVASQRIEGVDARPWVPLR